VVAGILNHDGPSHRAHDAWKAWNTDRKRATIGTVLHRVVIKPLLAGLACNPRGNVKDHAMRRERKWRSCGNASNSAGAF
jgi:hypothetical protein